MTRWGCPACRTVYAQRLFAGCPRCPGTALVEEANMPKITVSGGPSSADEPQPAEVGDAGPVETGEPTADEQPEPEGGEPPSVGSSSSPSEPKPRRNTGTRRAASPPPAPTTESP